ncbi:MAG: hypothetical protein AB9891_18585 [Anaerolineaceae bacterium]
MKKYLVQILPFAVLQAAGLSIFLSFQFLSAGVRSLDKGLLILIGLWVIILAGLLAVYTGPLFRRRLDGVSQRTFLLSGLAALIAGGLFYLISPIPRPKDPSNWQVIEIQPVVSDGTLQTTLLQEIKLDGQPVPLEEYQNVPGWKMTEGGLQSEPGSLLPLLVLRKGALEKEAALLFEALPDSGKFSVRFGWEMESGPYDFEQDSSLIEVKFPAPPQSPWEVLFAAGLILASSALFMLAFVFIPAAELAHLAEDMTKLSRSVTFWILVGFLTCYAAFFFRPVFLNSDNIMRLENNLPAIYPIGNDLHLIMKSAGSLADGGSPYSGANKYPPAVSAVFTSLLGLNIRDAFRVLSTANLFFFIFLSLGFPLWLSEKKKLESFTWILFTAGLFTYGFLFEIERGQFNLPAVGLVFMALLIYHRGRAWRFSPWFAFILFCMGVQLKIYPAIFVLFFTRDWRDWKRNLLRWSALGLANLGLLLMLGWQVFADFFAMMTNVVSGMGFSNWPVSHSINGFISYWGSQTAWVEESARSLQIIFYLAVIALTALCLWGAVRRRAVLDPYLLLACTLAALTLPSLSNDYTLAFLMGPAVLFFTRLQMYFKDESGVRLKGAWLLLAVSALAYGSTFFSYFVKPPLLQNQFPALLVMLVCAAWFSGEDNTLIRDLKN